MILAQALMAAWTCSEELDRPENKGLKDIVGKLKKAKAAIDAGGERAASHLSPGNLRAACLCGQAGRRAVQLVRAGPAAATLCDVSAVRRSEQARTVPPSSACTGLGWRQREETGGQRRRLRATAHGLAPTRYVYLHHACGRVHTKAQGGAQAARRSAGRTPWCWAPRWRPRSRSSPPRSRAPAT